MSIRKTLEQRKRDKETEKRLNEIKSFMKGEPPTRKKKQTKKALDGFISLIYDYLPFIIPGVFFIFVCHFIITSYSQAGAFDADRYQLKLDCSYELVGIDADTQTQISGDISGEYLLIYGKMSGEIEQTTTTIYEYKYKRADGGIMLATINMASYNHPENVKVIVYESDSVMPKVEIWRNFDARYNGDGNNYACATEFRFTVPIGAFLNTYDFKG